MKIDRDFEKTANFTSCVMIVGMKLIAASEGVSIYCPEDGRFSFFNSPYPAHHSYTGVDLYPKKTFGELAPSPVEGEVKVIRKVGCPEGKGFRGTSHDYVILLRSLDKPERWIKILHVKPVVEVGDEVKPGEDLGTLIRSGYFNFWTDPHVHVEVRKPSDPLRARGGFEFVRLMRVGHGEALKELRGTVMESKPEYLLVALDASLEQGLPVDLGGEVGLLDAGIPHYGWIGVHLNDAADLKGVVRLCDKEIGTIKSTHINMCLAECRNLAFWLKGKRVGLSLYLYPSSEPLMKIIGQRPGRLKLRESTEVSVVIT